MKIVQILLDKEGSLLGLSSGSGLYVLVKVFTGDGHIKIKWKKMDIEAMDIYQTK